MNKLLILTILSFALATHGNAKELPERIKTEINQLLVKLESSNCRFNRNGNWYSSKEAKEHLEKKLAHILRKGVITTTEQFIDYAASKSSVTGTIYLVQCNEIPAIESQKWLLEQLKQLRE